MNDTCGGGGRRKSSSATKRLSKNGTETMKTERQPNTESQRGVEVLAGDKNQKVTAEKGIIVGHEVETVKNIYLITREIIKGRMSSVFEVRRFKDGKILALKVHPPAESGKPPILRHEAHVYHELSVLSKDLHKEEIRFLNVYDYGECSAGNFLFITLAGENLASILSDEKIPNYQTALDLSLQMLNALEQIHRLGFTHCHIRPNTWLTGYKSRQRYILFLANFSHARMANPTKAALHVNKSSPQVFDRYAPRCQHNGNPYYRRDDLESWFYLICDLFHPAFLPWTAEKRLKSAQIAELKDKLLKGDFYYRYAVMPKTFQAIAGVINETDARVPNYMFLKECLMDEAKLANCTFGCAWNFQPVADLPPVPEIQSQTRIDFEFNRCVQNPTSFNFGVEKSRMILPEDLKDVPEASVQVVLPVQPVSSKSDVTIKPKANESVIISMSDVVNPPAKTTDASKKENVSSEASSDEEDEVFKSKRPSQSCSSHTIQGISPGYRPPAASGSDTSIDTFSTGTLTFPNQEVLHANREAQSPECQSSNTSKTFVSRESCFLCQTERLQTQRSLSKNSPQGCASKTNCSASKGTAPSSSEVSYDDTTSTIPTQACSTASYPSYAKQQSKNNVNSNNRTNPALPRSPTKNCPKASSSQTLSLPAPQGTSNWMKTSAHQPSKNNN